MWGSHGYEYQDFAFFILTPCSLQIFMNISEYLIYQIARHLIPEDSLNLLMYGDTTAIFLRSHVLQLHLHFILIYSTF
jgi:hypothetical protein